MVLKIAGSGKGSVGKTTMATVLVSLYARDGKKVIAVDADPATSLPAALGAPEAVGAQIILSSCKLNIIEERPSEPRSPNSS
jgi:CO dehydrogenase maturation factor